MKISIITPCYNAARFLSETIDSILDQSYGDWELIVVDDCSTDTSRQILTDFSNQDDRIHVLFNEFNQGAAASRNKAIEIATGEFLAFIDADDRWMPNKLRDQLEAMLKSNLAFSFTSYDVVDELGGFTGQTVDTKSKALVDYHDMLAKRATIGCSTVMLDLRRLGEIRMPLIRTGQDYGLWLQILKCGHKAQLVPKVLSSYRKVSGSISANKLKKARRQWQIYRQIENLALFPSVYYFLNYAYRAVFRK